MFRRYFIVEWKNLERRKMVVESTWALRQQESRKEVEKEQTASVLWNFKTFSKQISGDYRDLKTWFLLVPVESSSVQFGFINIA